MPCNYLVDKAGEPCASSRAVGAPVPMLRAINACYHVWVVGAEEVQAIEQTRRNVVAEPHSERVSVAPCLDLVRDGAE